MHGLEPLRSLFNFDGFNGAERRFNPKIVMNQHHVISKTGRKNYYSPSSPGRRFIRLHEVGRDFPARWDNSCGWRPPVVRRRTLLLSEHRELLTLDCCWRPCTDWTSDRLSPDAFWYENRFAVLADADLPAYLVRAQKQSREFGYSILASLRNIASLIASDLESTARLATERVFRHEARIGRLR
jgi:hypothetical protein